MNAMPECHEDIVHYPRIFNDNLQIAFSAFLGLMNAALGFLALLFLFKMIVSSDSFNYKLFISIVLPRGSLILMRRWQPACAGGMSQKATFPNVSERI